MSSKLLWTLREGKKSPITIPPPTCCTGPSTKSSENMSSRQDPSSTRSASALTSAITKRSTLEEIRQIEDLVNGKIRENLPVNWYEIKYDEAQKREDIKQFFGEKYGSVVRVVDIDYSKELCGGTHTAAVGNIGLFRIAKERSIAAGIRRIEAVTGQEAEALNRQHEDTLLHLGQLLKAPLH